MFINAQIQNKLEAYLLGLFYADGCIQQFQSGKWRVFSINLKESDKDYLQNICNIINANLNTNYQIRYQKKTKSYKLTVCKGVFISNLLQLGVIPRKSWSNLSDVFDNIPDNLKWDWLLGYWDGDGYISKLTTANNSMTGVVSLNETLLNSITKFINTQFNKPICHVRQDGKYFRINMKGNVKVKAFLDRLYKDNCIYLPRKYNVYQTIQTYLTNGDRYVCSS